VKRRVRFLPGGRRDLARLANFLAERNPQAASNAIEAILAAAGSLSEFAERGVPSRSQNARKLFVPFGRSAYIIHYRVEAEEVLIARIFHSLEDRPLA